MISIIVSILRIRKGKQFIFGLITSEITFTTGITWDWQREIGVTSVKDLALCASFQTESTGHASELVCMSVKVDYIQK